jgi:pimeloyl-ACP methyl ester carboxylesterase
MNRTRRLILATVVLLAALIAQLAPHLQGLGTQPQAAAATPPLVRGALTFTPCELKAENTPLPPVKAECTHFDVPEDWDHPQGRHLSLNVALVPSSNRRPAPDLVTFLDGGPGGAATEDYPLLAAAFQPIAKYRDVLLVDQRGTGHSNPLSCRPIPDVEPTELRRRCAASLEARADLRFYRTTDAARDLEALRLALKAPAYTLVGVSYGTRMAQIYAKRYPKSVRAMVLDSSVPNALTLGSEHAQNLEYVLNTRFARCVADAACKERFNDPAATLKRLADRLSQKPASVEVRDPVTFVSKHATLDRSELASLVRLYAYNPVSAALLPLTLDEADKGVYGPLIGQVALLKDDLSTRLAGGMELSVICAEDADLLTANAADRSTLLGEFADRLKAACGVWPHGDRPADFHAPLEGPVPVLLLEGELDPVTPPRYATEIASHLPNARVIVLPGQGHSVMGTGCLPDLVGKFVKSADAHALDVTCTARERDRAPFMTYSGSTP